MRTQHRQFHRSTRVGRAASIVSLLLALALIASACGSDDAIDAVAESEAADDADAGGAEEPTTDADDVDIANATDDEVADADADTAAEAPAGVESVAFINTRAQPLVGVTAQEMGFFEDEGLSVEFSELDTGTESIAAMLGGSADIVTGADARLLQGLDQGLPIVAIGIQNTGFLGNLLVAADNTEVTGMEDLVDQRVGVQVGSGVHTAWLRYLDGVGLEESDFQVTNLSVPDMPAAIIGDSIDAALMWNPNAYNSESEGITRLVTSSAEFAESVGLVYPFFLLTTQKMIDERPEAVQSFVNAWTCSQNWIADNREEAIDILANQIDGVERDVLEVSFDEVDYTEHQVIDDEVIADLQGQGEKLVENDALAAVPELESGIDNSFVETAVAEGC